jgi:hypothetical protein
MQASITVAAGLAMMTIMNDNAGDGDAVVVLGRVARLLKELESWRSERAS